MNSSEGGVTLSSPLCRFCEYLRNSSPQEGINTPWVSDGTYSALVSVGALVSGWTLICPIEHELNMATHYRSAEMWAFVSTVEDLVRQRYGEVRLFEHGARFDGSLTGCGTDHAHLHLVPLDFLLIEEALQFDRTKVWQPCLASDIEEHTGGQEYLFVADCFARDRTEGMLCLLTKDTSQFFRRVIAHRLGLSDCFDYRRHPMMDIAESSAKQLRLDAGERKKQSFVV